MSDAPPRGPELAAPADGALSDASAKKPKDPNQKAGRGLLVITGAKVYFVVTSFGIQLALPSFFDGPRVFGQFGTIMAAISILNNVLIAATIQSVSKLVSEDEARGPAVLRQGVQIQLVVGGVLSALLFGAAPYFAAFHADPALAPMMRVSSSVVLAYALYAALIGDLNGRQRFATQAKFDIGFSTLRTLGIVGGAALGLGAFGAVTGGAGPARPHRGASSGTTRHSTSPSSSRHSACSPSPGAA